MTEYDFSPAAYERYIDKQRSVSDWVYRTQRAAPSFSNPFVPSVLGSPALKPAASPSRSQSVSRRSHSPSPIPQHTVRPQPLRSSSIPIQHDPRVNVPTRSRSYSMDHQAQPVPRSYSPPQSSSHTRSHSQRSHNQSHSRSNSARYYRHEPVPQPPHASQQPRALHPQIYQVNPVRSNSVPVTYVNDRPVYIPSPRPGQQYYVIPNGGRPVEVISPTSQKHSQPLLKRLLTSFGPRIAWSNGLESKGKRLRRTSYRRTSY